MKRLPWLWWTCAGSLLVIPLVLGANRVRARAEEGSSAESLVAQNDDAGRHMVSGDEREGDDEDEKGRENEDEHEDKEHGEHEHKAAQCHENEHEAAEGREEHERRFRFSKADVGKTPRGWTVAKTGRGEGSEWKVVADPTAPSGTGCVLAQTAKSPGRVFNLCVVDDSKYRDVEIEVRFKAMHGAIDQGGGIVWRYQDANNYYIARMNPLEDNYRLYKVVKGRRTQLASKEHILVPAGQWHTLKIECEGNEIECELDGKKLLEKEDNTFKQAGKIGLWTKADAQTYFDNFEVEQEGDED